MKRSLFLSLLLTLFIGVQSGFAKAPAWEFDKDHSNFYFSVDHIFSKIRGHFEDYSGAINFDPANLEESSFLFEIKVDSINTHIAKRDKHLLSDDFFSAADFPLMRFQSSSISKSGDNSYNIAGTFTVKGKEYDLTVPLTLVGVKEHPMMKGTEVAGFNGTLTIDRLAYGVGSGKFYEYGVVGKDVEIFISLEVLRKK
ncbi:MAG: YceI family protein [Desulfopila sp.]|jgi:polyisoprenoid-binding protein YceI|nr:YceI family protein [Desulfopila sp.]